MSTASRFVSPLILMAMVTAPVAAQTSTCAEIRDTIAAQTGPLVKPDFDLLRTLALRKECRFTAAEVYRAAYGDKLPPRHEQSEHHRHRDDDD